MVMHRSFMTVALASVLVGGLGLSAFSQTSPAPTGQGSQGVESSEPFQHVRAVVVATAVVIAVA